MSLDQQTIDLDLIDLDPADRQAVTPTNVPTVKQVEFARSLWTEARDLLDTIWKGDTTPEAEAAFADFTLIGQAGATAKEAGRAAFSAYIDSLIAYRDTLRKAAATLPTPGPAGDVPAGRYAIEEPDGSTTFWKVDRPDSGKWAGYTFVKMLVASPSGLVENAVRNKARREAVLAAVAQAGVAESSRLFGKRLGVCGVCGSPLTNEESRARGIGPVCEGRL